MAVQSVQYFDFFHNVVKFEQQVIDYHTDGEMDLDDKREKITLVLFYRVVWQSKISGSVRNLNNLPDEQGDWVEVLQEIVI